ncbi:MAG: hypothetical protein K1Y36_07955 [Blastocatellia bacterium]|nr:hypothetical protein [Blastocatellia bacterium]
MHLILVPCHAVYLSECNGDPRSDKAWWLQSFQAGEPPFYIEHIQAGVELAKAHPDALLMFSGGQTRREAGPLSEAESYRKVAVMYDWWAGREVAERAQVEEFARDSFENLLFGICRMRECTGIWPSRVSVVGWEFKARRFDLHRAALRFPAQHFCYHGVNNPPALEAAIRGEEQFALEPFSRSPYGGEPVLEQKRQARNPFQRTHSYHRTCPDLAALLNYRENTLFSGILPWDNETPNPTWGISI